MSDWDHRQLCSDGACVGVINDEGVCKVCGRAAQNWGDERKRGMVDASADEAAIDEDEDGEDDDEDESDEDGDGGDGGDEDDDEDDDDDEDADEGDEDDGVIGATSGDPDWGNRTLCPDGGCVGVIGVDGKCKSCGRAAA